MTRDDLTWKPVVQDPNDPSWSEVQSDRSKYWCVLPNDLKGGIAAETHEDVWTNSGRREKKLHENFPSTRCHEKTVIKVQRGLMQGSEPVRVGIVFCGRQTPGGHNVISGLFDFLKKRNPDSVLIGFMGGSKGLIAQRGVEVTRKWIDGYRNQGGYDMLGRTVDMLHGEMQQRAAMDTCKSLQLDGLVMVGGSYTISDAALLAEYFQTHQCHTKVIGVPGTINGDTKHEGIEACFGFDTATKLFSQLIGNIAIDGRSAKKYYFFMRLMGLEHSHVTLECALQTQPNFVLIGEEVKSKTKTLNDVTREIADVICKRAEAGKDFGVVLLPEGLVSFFPEISVLVKELNDLLKCGVAAESVEDRLSPWNKALFNYLPESIRNQLLLEREIHGGIQHSQIETERLLLSMVTDELEKRKAAGEYKGSFNGLSHFFGYQARGSLPSNFDCNLAYTVGSSAAALILNGYSGVYPCIRGLGGDPTEWKIEARYLVRLMDFNESEDPRISHKQVDLEAGPFKTLQAHREDWVLSDDYCNPGPIQFAGPTAGCTTYTLEIEHKETERSSPSEGL